jgi:L-arabinokinase
VIAAYVSGHGFGHATRTAEVLRALRALAPRLPVSVASAAPHALFASQVAPPFEHRYLECDVGLVQKGALEIDLAGTAERWRAWAAGWDARVDHEAAWLRSAGVSLVLGDIPPLAFAAAARAGVPSVGLANFSWDWVYRHLSAREPALGAAADLCAAAYGRATRLFRLPFAGDLAAFRAIEDVPLVARRPRLPRPQAQARLGLGSRPVVLLSFGGLGLPGFSPEVLAGTPGLQFLVPNEPDGLPANVASVHASRLAALGLEYVDVVGAADVVVTKPGYGIVSDAIGAQARLVYTDRGDFPEYPVIVGGLERWLPSVYVTNEEVRSGRLGDAVRRVLAMPFPPAPDMGGADVAARRLQDLLNGQEERTR